MVFSMMSWIRRGHFVSENSYPKCRKLNFSHTLWLNWTQFLAAHLYASWFLYVVCLKLQCTWVSTLRKRHLNCRARSQLICEVRNKYFHISTKYCIGPFWFGPKKVKIAVDKCIWCHQCILCAISLKNLTPITYFILLHIFYLTMYCIYLDKWQVFNLNNSNWGKTY